MAKFLKPGILRCFREFRVPIIMTNSRLGSGFGKMLASSIYVINLGRKPSLAKLLDLYILYFTSASGCFREFGFDFHEFL